MSISLSILIPMYNAELYIERCLESIFQQGLDHEEYEVIIMNDGSTDSSPKLVQGYIDKGYPVTIHTHKNIGVDATRNKGFEHIRGKYLYIMDADDYLAYNCLNTILQRGLKDDLQIVAFGSLFTDEEANFQADKNPENIPKPNVTTGKEYLKEHRDTRFETWWYFVKTEFLEETGVRFEADNACSDTYYMLEHFLKAERVVYYPVEIYRYYAAPTSLTRNKDDGKFIARMFNDFSKSSVGFSEILLNIKNQQLDPQLWDNLSHRRDAYVFYYISLMVRSGLSKKEMRTRLNVLEEKDGYPIKNFIGPEYNSPKWRFFNYIFNHQSLLINLTQLYQKFKR